MDGWRDEQRSRLTQRGRRLRRRRRQQSNLVKSEWDVRFLENAGGGGGDGWREGLFWVRERGRKGGETE